MILKTPTGLARFLKSTEMRGDRALAVTFGAVAATVIAFFLYQNGPRCAWYPGCLFHRLTGLACPGCGMTRATYAALHGRFGEALRFNPLGMIVLPALGVFFGMQIPAWLRGEAQAFRWRVGRRGAWWLVGIVLGYWVLRNIAIWPFTLLAAP